MADEAKTPEKGELSEEQLKDVSGGVLELDPEMKVVLPLDKTITGSGQAEGIMGSGGEDR